MHQGAESGQSRGHRDRTLTREEGDGHIDCSRRCRNDPREHSIHVIDDGVQLRGTATSRAVEQLACGVAPLKACFLPQSPRRLGWLDLVKSVPPAGAALREWLSSVHGHVQLHPVCSSNT